MNRPTWHVLTPPDTLRVLDAPAVAATDPLQARLVALSLPLRRAILTTNFRQESCIASARIGIEALARLGIAAEPLRVQAAVCNAAFTARMAGGAPLPDQATLREWQRQAEQRRQPVPWSVGIGHDHASFGQSGLHVAVLVGGRSGGWLWDLSLDQANRPRHAIALGPLVAPAAEPFVWGAEPLVAATPAGVVVQYHALRGAADDRRYESSPNWGARDALTRAAIIDLAFRAAGTATTA